MAHTGSQAQEIQKLFSPEPRRFPHLSAKPRIKDRKLEKIIIPITHPPKNIHKNSHSQLITHRYTSFRIETPGFAETGKDNQCRVRRRGASSSWHTVQHSKYSTAKRAQQWGFPYNLPLSYKGCTGVLSRRVLGFCCLGVIIFPENRRDKSFTFIFIFIFYFFSHLPCRARCEPAFLGRHYPFLFCTVHRYRNLTCLVRSGGVEAHTEW